MKWNQHCTQGMFLKGYFIFIPDETFENDREAIHTAIYKNQRKTFRDLGRYYF